ncbi:MAG: ATP-dependent protease, partial [Verrucomicrobia bacterium]
IASAGGIQGRDVSGRGVQTNLLKLMEETEVNLHSQTDILGQMQAVMEMQRGGRPRPRTINTRHILFIVSGAFDKLADQVRKRITSGQIGFAHSGQTLDDDAEVLSHVETADIVKYGFEPEFVGRLPVRVACHPLKPADLREILLTSEGSVLNQYREDFAGYGIDFELTDDAVDRIAEDAYKEGTGARGLLTVLERLFRDFKFELPSTAIRSFKITRATIDDPRSEVKALLKANSQAQRDVLAAEVADFAKRFQREHGFELQFTDDAIEALVDESLERDKTIRALCEAKFNDFHHGLKLVSRHTGSSTFTIDRRVILDPEGELSRWVVESFKGGETPSSDTPRGDRDAADSDNAPHA